MVSGENFEGLHDEATRDPRTFPLAVHNLKAPTAIHRGHYYSKPIPVAKTQCLPNSENVTYTTTPRHLTQSPRFTVPRRNRSGTTTLRTSDSRLSSQRSSKRQCTTSQATTPILHRNSTFRSKANTSLEIMRI